MTDLTILGKTEELYRRMRLAIAECHSYDECKDIADRAAAMQTYCKQVNDLESVQKFVTIRLRAWRRISQLCEAVDGSGCETQLEHINRIRAIYASITQSQAYQALRIAKIPDEFFEKHVEAATSISALLGAYQGVVDREWRTSPEGRARIAKAEKDREQADAAYRQAEQAHQARERDKARLAALRDEALTEVGVTLDRRDRKDMKEILLLIQSEIHDTLRQAAFDKHVTMQSVLRAGLAMWFLAHGYEVPKALTLPVMPAMPEKRGPGRPPKYPRYSGSPAQE